LEGSRGLARAAAVIMVMTLLSRLLGLVRDASIAAIFGATGITDAYLVAYTIPFTVQTVLGIGFVTVIVPVITSYLVRNERDEAWRVAGAVLTWTGVVLAGIALLGVMAAPMLVGIIAPGFEPEVFSLAVHLTRIMFPSILFVGLGMLASGVLNAGHRFAIPALAPAVPNVAVIFAVLGVGSLFGVTGVAWATLAGFVGFLLVQMPSLRGMGFTFHPSLAVNHPVVRRVGAALGPLLLAVSINQIYLIMNRFFASGLLAGSITALDLGNRALQLPGIFVNAVYTVTFPALAEQAVRQEREGLTRTIRQGLILILLVIIPASVGMMVLREPIIKLLYGRGAFDQAAVEMTALALLYFAVGFPAQAANQVLTRTFYAMEDVSTPVCLGLVSVALNGVLSLWLVGRMGYSGLALANSVATVVNMVVLLVVLHGRLPGLDLLGLTLGVLKIGVAALAAGTAMAAVAGWAGTAPGFGSLLLRLTIAAGVGGVTFLAGASLLRVPELRQFLGLVRRSWHVQEKGD